MLGRAAEGLARLDEVMVAVTAGELSPIPSGIVYCEVLQCCRRTFDVRRAHEWTRALDRWCAEQPDMVAFSGQCHAHRAELFLLHGAWADALAAAEEARQRSELGDPNGMGVLSFSGAHAPLIPGPVEGPSAAVQSLVRQRYTTE